MKLVSAIYMNFVSSLYSTLVQFLEGVFHLNILSKNNRSILIKRIMFSLGDLNGLFIVRESNSHNNCEYTSCAITTFELSFVQKVTQTDNDGTGYEQVSLHFANLMKICI